MSRLVPRVRLAGLAAGAFLAAVGTGCQTSGPPRPLFGGPLANVNVGVSQNIEQFQKVDVNTLNNVGSIGPGFGPLSIDVEPKQLARAAAIF